MESIKEKLEKSKSLRLFLENRCFFAILCFILGVIVIIGSVKLSIVFAGRKPVNVVNDSFFSNLSGKEGAFVGSKTGKSYYFPWCGTVGRIKDENLVWFSNRAEAEAKGYVPASNCRGLK